LGIVLNWNSTYPGGGIDNTTINFPPVSDGIHDVLATHVNALANAVINLETAVGTLGGLGVREVDSTPNIRPVHTLVFPNGSLTDLGSNTVQVSGASGGGAADDITYDNGVSGLSSTNVQDALDEIVALTPGGPGLNFRPVAADFDTPIVPSGSVTVAISDIAGGSAAYAGLPRNFLEFEFEDPTSGTIVLLPIITPTVLPDRFKLNLGLVLNSATPEDFSGGITFTDVTVATSIGLNFNFNTVVVPEIVSISGGTGGTTVSWELPSATFGDAKDVSLLFDSVQPFSATAPQLVMDFSVRGIGVPPTTVYTERFYSSTPSTGSMITDLPGISVKYPHMYFVFPTGFVGTINMLCWIDIQRHPEDNI